METDVDNEDYDGNNEDNARIDTDKDLSKEEHEDKKYKNIEELNDVSDYGKNDAISETKIIDIRMNQLSWISV